MPGRFNFDRVADVYEATRRLPPLVLDGLAEQIAAAFESGRVLDVGVGTGRYAEALRDRGFAVVGLDVAAKMLERARARSLPDLVQGDAARLPFRDGAFDHALVLGLLHFLPTWREAVREVGRVARTYVASTAGGMRDTPIGDRYVAALRAQGWSPPESTGIPVDALADLVAPALRFPKITHEEDERTDEHIDRFERRVFTWQWDIPDDVHAAAMEGIREAFGGRTFRAKRTWELLLWRAEALRGL